MSDEITYAKVNGPPDDWMNLKVTDLDTGKEAGRVIEVNTVEGWIKRWPDPIPAGLRHRDWPVETIYGRFSITRR